MPSKYSFQNDYSENAHPSVLTALSRDTMSQEPGYGDDAFSAEAAELIRSKCRCTDASVYFVSGGTQANLVVCSAVLKPYESIIAADSGHICVHEAGAIEATGHKVHAVSHVNGKLTPDSVKRVVSTHSSEHMVKPRMVFISQATELGTVYTLKELTEISEFCRSCGLLLYLDGARLGAALASDANDMSLEDVARLVDVFYLGGTKNGALFGEAIVFCKSDISPDFRFHLKQNGALLAKSRVLGVQFRELLRNDLFGELARISVEKAKRLADGLSQNGYPFEYPVQTNQIFPRLPNRIVENLGTKFGFYTWSSPNESESVIRLVTSWATPDRAIDEFVRELSNGTR